MANRERYVMQGNQLSDNDYQRLAEVMAGPHGAKVSANSPVDVLIVFSCVDPTVGHAAASLYRQGLCRHVIFSGGVGKDSGGLATLGIAEAQFLASVAIADGLPFDAISLELEARNGKENAVLGLQLAAMRGLLTDGGHVASLVPAQRSRRLFEELRYQAGTGYPDLALSVSGLSSGVVDAATPGVQVELLGELQGLATMHAKAEPRIYRQDDFQAGGEYFELVAKAGIDS
ncbi:YdcF family protein [Nocardia sp. CA-107356]|uniref:YdcF family protein n=1 Tax=Nocardia sp. CA-107356 TaxID=3239972 RepID=UPI003D8B8B1B